MGVHGDVHRLSIQTTAVGHLNNGGESSQGVGSSGNRTRDRIQRQTRWKSAGEYGVAQVRMSRRYRRTVGRNGNALRISCGIRGISQSSRSRIDNRKMHGFGIIPAAVVNIDHRIIAARRSIRRSTANGSVGIQRQAGGQWTTGKYGVGQMRMTAGDRGTVDHNRNTHRGGYGIDGIAQGRRCRILNGDAHNRIHIIPAIAHTNPRRISNARSTRIRCSGDGAKTGVEGQSVGKAAADHSEGQVRMTACDHRIVRADGRTHGIGNRSGIRQCRRSGILHRDAHISAGKSTAVGGTNNDRESSHARSRSPGNETRKRIQRQACGKRAGEY